MVKKVTRPSGPRKVTLRYKAARPMSGEESTFTVDWLALIRAELPMRIEDLPDLRARWPGFGFRLAWPEDSPGLVLEVTQRPHGRGDSPWKEASTEQYVPRNRR